MEVVTTINGRVGITREWMIHTRQMWKNGTPMAYIAASDGQLHPYTTESLNDPRLSQLTRNYNADLFRPFTVPLSA